MTILSRRAVIAAKEEATEGTAETLAAADANFLVVEPRWTPDISLFKRANVDSSLSPFSSVPGTRQASLSFKVEIKGSGTAGTAPALGKLIKACGFAVTNVPVTSDTYDPISTTPVSLTIALFKDGLKHQIRGARGSMKYDGKVGEPGMLEFTFLGVYDGVTDVALLVGSGIETTLPPALLSAAFTIQGFAAKIAALSIDMANAVELRSDISKAEGFFSAVITGREPKGSMDPEDELVATHDWHGIWIAGTEGLLTFVHGATGGNICTITGPKAQYARVAEGDRGGIATRGLDFLLNRSLAAGDDEVKLAFT